MACVLQEARTQANVVYLSAFLKCYANVQIYSNIIKKTVVPIVPLTLLRRFFRIWIKRAPRMSPSK